MNPTLGLILSAVTGYLLGNFSAGILISKAFGVKDIRKTGSGSSGSTNVLRTLGWLPSIMTLVGDCLKAFVAAMIGRLLAGEYGMLVGGLFAVIGHDFPVFLGFKGGKGIASTLGLLLAVDWRAGLILLGLVLLISFLTHYVSVGSITAAIIMPFLIGFLNRGRQNCAAYIICTAIAGALAVFCHRANIARLLAGKENRLDFKKISRISSKFRKG